MTTKAFKVSKVSVVRRAMLEPKAIPAKLDQWDQQDHKVLKEYRDHKVNMVPTELPDLQAQWDHKDQKATQVKQDLSDHRVSKVSKDQKAQTVLREHKGQQGHKVSKAHKGQLVQLAHRVLRVQVHKHN